MFLLVRTAPTPTRWRHPLLRQQFIIAFTINIEDIAVRFLFWFSRRSLIDDSNNGCDWMQSVQYRQCDDDATQHRCAFFIQLLLHHIPSTRKTPAVLDGEEDKTNAFIASGCRPLGYSHTHFQYQLIM